MSIDCLPPVFKSLTVAGMMVAVMLATRWFILMVPDEKPSFDGKCPACVTQGWKSCVFRDKERIYTDKSRYDEEGVYRTDFEYSTDCSCSSGHVFRVITSNRFGDRTETVAPESSYELER